MARRLSYASVLSGNAAASTPNFTPPATSGAFSHVMNQNQSSASLPPDFASQASSYPPRLSDIASAHSIGHSLPDSLDKGHLPPYSSPFSQGDEGLGHWRFHSRASDFFVPSYLRGSRLMDRLTERNRARLAAKKETKSHRLSNAGSLSTTPSSANLHKMAPSHRGVTHDIIERIPAVASTDDNRNPLPSRWSNTEKCNGLELNGDGTEVKLTSVTRTQEEAAAVRSDHPVPKECGIYYFEITILGKGKDGLVGVGLEGPKVALNRIPGWENESWAYHSDDGSIFCQTSTPKSYGPKFGIGDVVGCGINFANGTCFFTKNGNHLGTAFREIKAPVLYPSIGMKKPGEHIKVNFGRETFVFDIDKLVEQERAKVRAEVSKQDISRLSSKNENDVLQQLVIRYLIHEGYMETARAFAQAVHTDSSLLRSQDGEVSEFQYSEEPDALNRQRIRTAILEGDVDKALKLTTAYYPNVLRDNESIYFKLRCRKFIEMIRKCTDLQPGYKGKRSPTANGHTVEDEDIFNGQMELDQNTNGHEDFDGMDIEEPDASVNEMDLMNAALKYGQELQREFKDDQRKEVKQALENTFALIAYPDARESSLAPLLEVDGRIPVAEALNSAILVSLGKSSTSALERLYQHTEILTSDLSQEGGAASLLNVRDEYFRCI